MLFMESSYLHYWNSGNLEHFVIVRAGWVISVEKFTSFQGTYIGMESRTCSKKLQLDSVRLTECQCKEAKAGLVQIFKSCLEGQIG